MLPSIRSLINKPWLNLLLPALMLMIALMVMPGHGSGQMPAQHPALSQAPQVAALMLPLPALSPGPGQQPDAERPLFMLASCVEPSELGSEGLMALGLMLLGGSALTLAQLRAHALARMHRAALSPLTERTRSPLFIRLQVFRL